MGSPGALDRRFSLLFANRDYNQARSSKICYDRIGDPLMPDVQKISIALTAEQIGALKAAVETGEYATTSEIVREEIGRAHV